MDINSWGASISPTTRNGMSLFSKIHISIHRSSNRGHGFLRRGFPCLSVGSEGRHQIDQQRHHHTSHFQLL